MRKSLEDVASTGDRRDQHWADRDENDLPTWWAVDVDENGIAYTFCSDKQVYLDDDEIQHVQDFFAGKYCAVELRGEGWSKCHSDSCYDASRAGTWK